MHGVRKALLQQQADALGIPLHPVFLPENVSYAAYEEQLATAIQSLTAAGYTHAAFGDILLEDLREYREKQLAALGVEAIFPLWQKDTAALAHQFLQTGFKAIVVAADAAKLAAQSVGRLYDKAFLRDLPPGVDPCGENGEFHTFCFDGPVFDRPVLFQTGETVYREYPPANGVVSGFWYCDLLPVG